MKKIFIFLVLIFITLASSVTLASISECVDDKYGVLEKIGPGVINTTINEKINFCRYASKIGTFETQNQNENKNYCYVNGSKVQYTPGNKPSGCDPGTNNTAKGYYQFTDDTFKDTLGYIEEYSDYFPVHEYIHEYTQEEQTFLVAALWAKRDHDSVKDIFDKDPNAALILYCEKHYTRCEDLSPKRWDQLVDSLESWAKKDIDLEVIAKYTQKGTDISAEERKKLEEERWAEKCEGRTYGLVGYEGGICSGEQSGSAAFIALIQNALAWVIRIAFLVAVLAIFYAGFILVTANGQPAKRTQALSILKNVIIGLFLISAAWLLVDWFFELFIPAENISDYKWIKNN